MTDDTRKNNPANPAAGGPDDHPDLSLLLAHARGELPASERDAVGAHLSGCALCRLEVLRFQRFENAEGDDEAARDAGWNEAQEALDGWSLAGQAGTPEDQKPRPPATGESRSAPLRVRRRRLWVPVYAPLAAAAVLAVFVVWPRLTAPPVGQGDGPRSLPPAEVMRGGGEAPAAAQITLQRPRGDVDAAPTDFVWSVAAADSSLPRRYTLEIFTADLDVVFRQENIPHQPADSLQGWTAGADLAGRLQAGQTYLWSVSAYRDLVRVGESSSGWFKLEAGAP